MQDKAVALVTGAKDLAAHGFTVGKSQVISMRPRMPVIRTTLEQMRAEPVRAIQPTVLKEKNRLAGEVSATSIVRAAAVMPSVAFTPSGLLVYQWRDARYL